MILSPSPRAISWSPALALAAMTFSGTWVNVTSAPSLVVRVKGNPSVFAGVSAPWTSPAGVGLAAGAGFWPAVPQAVRPRARARVRGTSFFMIILLFCAVDRKIPLSDGKRDCSSPWAQSDHTAANRQATFCGRHLSFCTDSRFPDLRLSAGPRLLVSPQWRLRPAPRLQ